MDDFVTLATLLYNDLQRNKPDDDEGQITEGPKRSAMIKKLVLAVETSDIYGKDQFGRILKLSDDGIQHVMDLLGLLYRQEQTYENDFAEYLERMDTPLSPLERYGEGLQNAVEAEEWVNPYEQFGWSESKLPNFDDKQQVEGGKKRKPREYLNHDPELQAQANEIAAKLKEKLKRTPTKHKVAQELAKECKLTQETVERRIRKDW